MKKRWFTEDEVTYAMSRANVSKEEAIRILCDYGGYSKKSVDDILDDWENDPGY